MISQVRNIQLKVLKYSVGSNEGFGLFPKAAALTPRTKRESQEGVAELMELLESPLLVKS